MRRRDPHDSSIVATDYWHIADDGRIECDLCPRHCRLKDGQRGLCFVRAAQGGELVLTTYGRSSGFCIDPIEKKPLYHFLPGTSVLSFGTAGCNLFCKFCQNWDLSKSREMDRMADRAEPQQLALAVQDSPAKSVAFTYNDPIIFHEYAVDVANACRELGISTVAVTAGYINPEPRREFFAAMDAANVDLKAFNERFYHKLTGAKLGPVLETLEYIYHHTDAWLELTTLIIPGENDSDEELEAMARWVVAHLGVDVPMHFSAFHPAFKMTDRQRTPAHTLQRARYIAMQQGVRYAYTGNVIDPEGGSTYCHICESLLIERTGYRISKRGMDANGLCKKCQTQCDGRF
ncbi:AmmeMemoRadiSam system radical SAM enzyme [Halorhodospira halochloris]|uniref:AmmeMemoRadiSam system radical SAM enzyme n=1 Tax=Halorhodospira halochloris TaxID=1052 RepID=UPI001EE80C03|nr:AmmeMemoRadiSam system radical SAM enzyme [Halorhodospira halochloris]MCG5529829.1 AmmeMemoRadiSam system radical SAM enzyme [Halorhodospira halochloris]